MRMRWVLSSLLVAFSLLACNDELSVEQQVIATLRSMEAAAEEGQHFEFMGYVADTFSGQQDSMDRREFHRFMIFQINQNRRLQAKFFPIHVQSSIDDQAVARFKLLVTGGGGLLPERGELFAVETHWLRDGGDWKLDKADWESALMPESPPLSQ